MLDDQQIQNMSEEERIAKGLLLLDDIQLELPKLRKQLDQLAENTKPKVDLGDDIWRLTKLIVRLAFALITTSCLLLIVAKIYDLKAVSNYFEPIMKELREN